MFCCVLAVLDSCHVVPWLGGKIGEDPGERLRCSHWGDENVLGKLALRIVATYREAANKIKQN